MFREASVFVPEFIVLRWLRWSNGFVGVVEPDQSIVFYGLESCWRSGALVAKVNGFDAEDFSSLEPRIRCFVRLAFLYLSLLFCAGCDGRTALSVGVVEPDQSIVFYGLESCWRSGVVEPDQSIVFYGFQKSPA